MLSAIPSNYFVVRIRIWLQYLFTCDLLISKLHHGLSEQLSSLKLYHVAVTEKVYHNPTIGLKLIKKLQFKVWRLCKFVNWTITPNRADFLFLIQQKWLDILLYITNCVSIQKHKQMFLIHIRWTQTFSVLIPDSYTHLDVYKRQVLYWCYCVWLWCIY